MIHDFDIAKQIAKYLLQINAIILQPDNPFTWASGLKSPIYCDNRKTLSFPDIRNFIRQSLSNAVIKNYKGSNIIAGVATAGIPHGTLVAEELGLPFIYVRGKAKKHGKENKIEGFFEKEQSVVLIEDLISTGMSSIEAANTLKSSGLNVKGIISIFNYNLDQASKNFQNKEYSFFSLCDYNILLSVAKKYQYINNNDIPILENWRANPSKWKPSNS